MGVSEYIGSDIPNLMKDVPNLIKDVPNVVKDVPRVPSTIQSGDRPQITLLWVFK